MKTYLIVAFFLVCCITAGYAQSPFLHLDSGEINPKLITSYGRSETNNTANDTISSSMINYNPALFFDGKDDYIEYRGKLKDLSNATVFTVFRSEKDSIEEAEVWGLHGESSSLGLTTKRILSPEMQSGYEGVVPKSVLLHVFTESNRSNSNNGKLDTFLSLGVIEKDSTNTYFKGSIAEVIAFDKKLKGKKRQILESTLAIKYGITLNNGEDYLLSNNRILWEAEDDSEFSNNIAGIGRDSSLDLEQKQSTSSNDPGFLAIGIDSIVASNKQNEGKLKNRHFLVWGDNNAPLTASRENNAEGRAPMLERKWLMKTTGKKASELKTQLQIDAKELFGGLGNKEDYSLIIDRSGIGDFKHENCSYILPSKLSEEGILTFSNLLWDIDGSGKDAFSFSLKKDLLVSLSGDESSVCNDSTTILNYEVEGGIPFYSYSLTSTSGFSKNWESNKDKEMGYSIKDVPAGEYTLSVTDYTGAVAQAKYQVMEEAPVKVELGPDRTLLAGGEELLLEPEISDKEKVVSYEWTSDNGFSSDQETITVRETGSYTLKLTTESGCTFSDTVTVTDNFVREFSLYPNPAPGGEFSILVGLAESSDVNIKIYNLMGSLVSEYNTKNRQRIEIKGNAIKASGLYTVVLRTSKGVVSMNLMVK